MSTKEQLESAKIIRDLKNVVSYLEEVIEREPTVDNKELTIHRFEMCFELSWKLMYRLCRLAGREVANSPRDSIRVAAQVNLIDDPSAWLDYVEHRNRTTHTYNEEIADQVYEAVRDFPLLVRDLLKSVEKSLTQTAAKQIPPV